LHINSYGVKTKYRKNTKKIIPKLGNAEVVTNYLEHYSDSVAALIKEKFWAKYSLHPLRI